MVDWQRLTATEQLTAHLRDELLRGRWVGTMPGVQRLAAEFSVKCKTAETTLQALENEGLLVGQGPGRRRKIVLPEGHTPLALRVAILCYEQSDQTQDYFIDSKKNLEAAGHTVFYAPSNLTEIKMDVQRLARMVKKIEADAWWRSASCAGSITSAREKKTPARR